MKAPHLVILGAAESGVGAALLARRQGATVFLSEQGKIKDHFRTTLLEAAIPFEEEGHTMEQILTAGEVIKSPGIPEKAAVMKAIRSAGIPVISEIEYAARYYNGTIIAISGTNGKTTTSSLLHHILVKAGLDAALVGNIGSSFAARVAQQDAAVYVVEVSSFQLDDCYEFHPHIALLLNISGNHLDRYDYELPKYAAAKFRLLQRCTSDDFFIYGADSTDLMENMPDGIAATRLPFTQQQVLPYGAFTQHDTLIINTHKNNFTMSIYELGLQGRHNLYNSMAAGIAACVLNIRKDTLRESLMDFKALEHRLEFVANIHGIEFINDSKSTTVNSAWYALESMNKPVVWVAGGVDKGNDYSILTDLVKQKVKAIVCLGLDNRKIHEAFASSVDLIVNTGSAEEAVKAAYHFATKGDAVLFSPSCASFDLFENYEDRGRQFKKQVRSL